MLEILNEIKNVYYTGIDSSINPGLSLADSVCGGLENLISLIPISNQEYDEKNPSI